MNLSLKYKIAAVIFLLEALMMTVVLWQTLEYAVKSAKQQIDAAEQVTIEIISEIGRIALLIEDFDRVQGYIEALPHNPNILKAILADDRGIIVSSNSLGDLGTPLPVFSDGEKTHWRIHSLVNVAGNLGVLAVLFSDEAQHATYMEALNRGIAIAAVGMSLIAVFGIGFGYLLTLRLQKVVHAAEEVALGNYSVRTGLTGTDELGQVGKAFDTMAQDIADERRALADANRDLEQRVRARTEELEGANREYESFAYAVSHDLRAPLRGLYGFSQALEEDYESQLDETARDYLKRIKNNALRMEGLIENLLKLSGINRTDINYVSLNASNLCEEIVDELRYADPEREVHVDIQPNIMVRGDRQLLRSALENLIGNAWKFTRKSSHASIHFGTQQIDGKTVYKIEDNGAGFEPMYANKLFTPFQRLHSEKDFPGTGIGLSTVQRIIHRHGGSIWASGAKGHGATFYFTLGARQG